MISEIEKLKAQIEALHSLKYTTAYTGSLDNIKHNSYVLYADVTKVMNKKRARVQQLEEELEKQ